MIIKHRLSNYSYFFAIRKLQIPFILLAFLICFIVGFFGVPQKYCYQAYCRIDKTKGASLYESSVVTVLLSEEYLNQLATHVKDERIGYTLLRKSISVDLVMSESVFTVTFAVSDENYATEIGKGFEEFTIDYLNEKVSPFKHTLTLDRSTQYKTHTIDKSLLSGGLCAITGTLLTYFAFATVNKDKMIEKQVRIDDND